MKLERVVAIIIISTSLTTTGCSSSNDSSRSGWKLVHAKEKPHTFQNQIKNKPLIRPRDIGYGGIQNKDLGISKSDFIQLFEEKLKSDPELAKIQRIDDYENFDSYTLDERDSIRVDYRKSKDNVFVQQINMQGYDLERFSKVQKMLFQAVFPLLTDSEYQKVNNDLLHKFDKSVDSSIVNDSVINTTWSENVYKHKYISLIKYVSKRVSTGFKQGEEHKLVIQPE